MREKKHLGMTNKKAIGSAMTYKSLFDQVEKKKPTDGNQLSDEQKKIKEFYD